MTKIQDVVRAHFDIKHHMFEYYYNSSAKLGNIKEIIREALDKYGENLELPCHISVNHLGKELAYF